MDKGEERGRIRFLYMSTTWVYLYICEPVLGLAFPSNVMQAFMDYLSLATFVSNNHTNGRKRNSCESHIFWSSTQITKSLQRVLCMMGCQIFA